MNKRDLMLISCQTCYCDGSCVVSDCDVVGSAALVGAVEGAGGLCSGGQIAGTHADDEEVYF